MLVAIFADLPNVMPGAIGFSIYHLKHHARSGDCGRDADIASHWEARLIGRRWYKKALWLLLLPLFQLTRPARVKGVLGGKTVRLTPPVPWPALWWMVDPG